MKRFIRYICLIIVAAVLMTVPALATESRASNYIMSTCVYLTKESSTRFDVWHEVIALGYMDELGAAEIKIQESTDGRNWTTVRTITPSDEPSMTIENDFAYASSVSYTGVSGRYYRARIIMFAENSTGRGEVITYTEPLKL